MLTIDGSYGEGGGQILRSSLTLSAVTGQAIQLINVRANRSKPGLRPQHLTAVRAIARLCSAKMDGAELNSPELTFEPASPVQPGHYTFDVTKATSGISAGSVSLVLQTILLPLALAEGASHVTLRGGTTVPMSPPALYLEQVYLPTLARMGVSSELTAHRWGFTPRGEGELELKVRERATLRPQMWTDRGATIGVEGIAFVSQLPSHIPQRMSDRARSILQQKGLPVHVTPLHVTAVDVAAGIFLWIRYENAVEGFLALGRRGLPAEKVAENACRDLIAYHETGAVAGPHMADQLVLPFILAGGSSKATVSSVTRHLLTNAWVAEQFELASIEVAGEEGHPGTLNVTSHIELN